MERYRCHRRPRTTQERRVNGKRSENEKRNFIDFDGYKVKVRASRNMSNLVEAWDDINMSSYDDRSWKKFRKTQYKPKDL